MIPEKFADHKVPIFLRKAYCAVISGLSWIHASTSHVEEQLDRIQTPMLSRAIQSHSPFLVRRWCIQICALVDQDQGHLDVANDDGSLESGDSSDLCGRSIDIGPL